MTSYACLAGVHDGANAILPTPTKSAEYPEQMDRLFDISVAL